MTEEKRRMSAIRKKMLLWFGIPILLLLSILGVINYIQVQDTVIPLTKELSQEVLVARSAEIGQLIQGYVSDVKTMSRRNLIMRGDWDEIREDLLERSSTIHSDYEILFFANTQGDFITTIGIEGNIADRDYFQALIIEGDREDFISSPMVSRSTGEEIFVVASAVINRRGERIGLIASTILLDSLSSIVASIKIGEHGFGYVVDPNGQLIAHPNDELRLKLNFLTSEAMGYDGLEEIGAMMVKGERGLGDYRRPDGSRFVTLFNPIPNTPNWSLGIALYEEELMGAALGLMNKIVFLMVGILIVVLLIVIFISRRISAPIQELKEGVKAISDGHLDERLTIKTGDEIEELSRAFHRMTLDLKNYIKNLRETTKEKERIESELQVANKIQTSMLPRIFPPYPNIENLDLYATMEPAREVGGDFYDFFLMDKGQFCFSIGDVSGKGVPAALFMVITRTILKNLALQNLPLQEILYQTNNMLCAENEENMFVTLFIGILNTTTGELEYASAGHNPPLVLEKEGEYAYLDAPKCLVLGGMEDYAFQSTKRSLHPKELLFLYTDGVTEAMNERGELYTDQRMLENLRQLQEEDVKGVIQGVREDIQSFVQDTPASDDITMLALSLRHFKPAPITVTQERQGL